MSTRLIIDGNSVYEIDEECEAQKKERRRPDAGKQGWGTRHQGRNEGTERKN